MEPKRERPSEAVPPERERRDAGGGAGPASDDDADASAALQAEWSELSELCDMSLRAVTKRATEMGVDEALLDAAEATDDIKGAIIVLILDAQQRENAGAELDDDADASAALQAEWSELSELEVDLSMTSTQNHEVLRLRTCAIKLL